MQAKLTMGSLSDKFACTLKERHQSMNMVCNPRRKIKQECDKSKKVIKSQGDILDVGGYPTLKILVMLLLFRHKLLCKNHVEQSLLNRLRELIEPTLTKLGQTFASTGLSANSWTGVGLAISILAAFVYGSTGFFNFSWNPWNLATVLGGMLLLVSGFFDIVDGSVARVTRQISKKGAFLDSVLDKVAEVAIFGGIAFGQLADSVWCLVALGMSLLVSYTRARAESLGGKLQGVGIGERAERLLIIAIIGMIPVREAMQLAMIIVSIVAGITLVQRIAVTLKLLSSSEA